MARIKSQLCGRLGGRSLFAKGAVIMLLEGEMRGKGGRACDVDSVGSVFEQRGTGAAFCLSVTPSPVDDVGS